MKRLKIILRSNTFYILFFLFLLFYCFYFGKIKTYSSLYPSSTTTIVGKIKSYTIDGNQLNLLVDAKEKVKATYTIASEQEKEDLAKNLKIGVLVHLTGKEKEIIGNTIPNTFDYQTYLKREKIYFCFSVSKITLENTKIGLINQIREKIAKRIHSLGDNPYMQAFILGDKTNLDQEQYNTIIKNGVSHLFALSGMHLSFIYLFLNKLLAKIKGKKGIIYILLLVYLFITGCSVSFLRAILFMFLLDLNKKLKLELSNLKVLFLTAFLLILFNPFYIYAVGFWYTFVVTFSLIFCHKTIQKLEKRKQILAISSITFLFSMPISIYMNYEINLFSIFNNIIFVPFISTIVFPLSFLTFFLPLFLPIFNASIYLLEQMNLFFSTFAFNLIVGKILLIDVLFLYFFLIFYFLSHQKKVVVAFIFFFLFLYNKNKFNPEYFVYFLDVGQGDSTLFISPYGKETILIDSGGQVSFNKKSWQQKQKEFDLGDNIVTFLKSKRIRKIDLFIATHGDYDHLGYASTIQENIPFKQVMINKGEENTYEQDLVKKSHQVNTYSSKHFDLTLLKTKLYENENDNSQVAKIKINAYTFLMMGDASSTVEEELMPQINFATTFLKLGHHGSNTSSSTSFLKKVNPKYAIISSGRNNIYHHPSIETINRLDALNISYFNTQTSGTIEIKIKQDKIHINEMLT